MEQHAIVVMPNGESYMYTWPSLGSEGSYTLPMPVFSAFEEYDDDDYGEDDYEEWEEWEEEEEEEEEAEEEEAEEEEGDSQTVPYSADLPICLAEFSDASDTGDDTPASLVCAICNPCRRIRIAFDGCTHAACRTCTLRLCCSRWEHGKSPPAWFPCPFCRTEVRRLCTLRCSEDDDGRRSWETAERGGVGRWLSVERWVADQYEWARTVVEEFQTVEELLAIGELMALAEEFSGGGSSRSGGGGGWVGDGSWSGDGSWTGGSSPPELGSP